MFLIRHNDNENAIAGLFTVICIADNLRWSNVGIDL
jgi:hypothetical protein